MDLIVELEYTINLQVPQEDLERIDVDVIVFEAARMSPKHISPVLIKAQKNIEPRWQSMWT